MERSSVRSNLCTDLREFSKTSWNSNLESLWNLEVAVGLVGGALFQSSPTLPQVSHTMVTLLHAFERSSPGEFEMPSFMSALIFEGVLDTSWSRGGQEVCSWVFELEKTERIVMDETGTYVVQSVRRVPEEQRYDHRLLQSVRGTPWEPNPGDVLTDLLSQC